MTLVYATLVCLSCWYPAQTGRRKKKCLPESHILGEAFNWGERNAAESAANSRSINEAISLSFQPARF
jgi:hypothetical protein